MNNSVIHTDGGTLTGPIVSLCSDASTVDNKYTIKTNDTSHNIMISSTTNTETGGYLCLFGKDSTNVPIDEMKGGVLLRAGDGSSYYTLCALTNGRLTFSSSGDSLTATDVICNSDNGNGWYTKFYDGTLICRQIGININLGGSVGSESSVTVEYPHYFSSGQINISLISYGYASNYFTLSVGSSSYTTSGFTIAAKTNQAFAGGNVCVFYTAIGKWY